MAFLINQIGGNCALALQIHVFVSAVNNLIRSKSRSGERGARLEMENRKYNVIIYVNVN